MNRFAFAFDLEHLLGALVTLATVMFLVAVAPGFRHRRAARLAAIAIFAVLFVAVAVWAALWLEGGRF